MAKTPKPLRWSGTTCQVHENAAARPPTLHVLAYNLTRVINIVGAGHDAAPRPAMNSRRRVCDPHSHFRGAYPCMGSIGTGSPTLSAEREHRNQHWRAPRKVCRQRRHEVDHVGLDLRPVGVTGFPGLPPIVCENRFCRNLKLATAAEKSWWRPDSYAPLPKVNLGVRFTDGIEGVRSQVQTAVG